MLNIGVHRKPAVVDRPMGFEFAAQTHKIILAPSEFFEACQEYPIIFCMNSDEKIMPMALMGFRTGENLFCDNKGQWTGRYIPAYVRRYLSTLSDAATDEVTVCIDLAFDGLNSEDGATNFDSEGVYSPYMKQHLEALRNFNAQFKNNDSFTEKLRELDLFKPMEATITLNDGRKFVLEEGWVVDERKLQGLGDEDMCALFKPGYLALVYAHLLSLGAMKGLVDRLSARKEDA